MYAVFQILIYYSVLGIASRILIDAYENFTDYIVYKLKKEIKNEKD